MTEVATTIAEVRSRVAGQRRVGKVIGFVPTMGALHAGHARLIERAAVEPHFVVVSIFVNPTQFGPNEDFDKYPRTLADDLQVCTEAGAALVFAPTVDEMYPRSSELATVQVPRLGDMLCGAYRPGHFQGVATVVLKLLNIVQPDLAYFGEKDYQQLAIVSRMVADLNVPTQICGVPTVREVDGLAMSSRNRYLDGSQRAAAAVIYRALREGADAVLEGEDDADRIRQILRSRIESEALARLQYAEVVDSQSLEPIARVRADRPARALVAAHFGSTRLIDNVALTLPAPPD